MKSRTCRYSIIIGQNAHLMKRLISLLLLFCIGLPLLAQQQRPAQTPKRDQKKKEVAEIDTIPLYNGTYVGVDLYGVGSKLLGGDFMSSEVSVAVNLKNKFIPTIEFGMGGTDTWSETGIHYKSKMAPFFRIGVDYNTMAKKKEKNSFKLFKQCAPESDVVIAFYVSDDTSAGFLRIKLMGGIEIRRSQIIS